MTKRNPRSPRMCSTKYWPPILRGSYIRPVRAAFTLVELLIVIFVIAILFLISLPAMSRARNAARNVQCLSNMHQLGVNHFAKTDPLYMFCPVDPTWKSRQLENVSSYTENKDLFRERGGGEAQTSRPKAYPPIQNDPWVRICRRISQDIGFSN